MRIRRAGDGDLEAMAHLRVAFLTEEAALDVDASDALFSAALDFFREGQRAGSVWTWLANDDDASTSRPRPSVTPAPVPGQAAGAPLGCGRPTWVGGVSLLVRPVAPHPSHPGSHEGYVVNMYVAPEARRAGVGRALLGALLSDAQAAGLRRVCLHASDDGRHLYESAGFVPEPEFLQRRLS